MGQRKPARMVTLKKKENREEKLDVETTQFISDFP
jgi:hypothetical protein